MSFELLSTPIKKYIRDKRWEELRPIQSAAIARILSTDNNYILASRTASGKTEAAFLPILSQVSFVETGVQVLYISPLIALINDQFLRIEQLCSYLDVTVTKWHGEANKSAKNRLVNEPNGIVLITPESIEAMFVNRPYYVRGLFSNLKFVIIDEIHSFIGSDRGTQLKSLLSRMQMINSKRFRIIGLSATIGDYTEAKKIAGSEEMTKVLLDKTSKDIEVRFRYFESAGEQLPLELLKDLYRETKDNKVLLFPNSRGRAEEVAVKLKKIAERVNGHKNYFSHHSSVDKEVREFVEHFAKNNERENFLISCTSTLELGIDIGSVDEVVQIDATHSVASLIQRVGRSGRRDGESSYLFLYATNEWSLLQSISCWSLYLDGYIDSPDVVNKPFDILLHQALSITKSGSGIKLDDLVHQLKINFAFQNIGEYDVKTIVDHLVQIDFLEKIQQEVIIGIEGEKIVNSRDFYSVFKTEESFKVVNGGNAIGDLPFSLQIQEGENIFLAAKVWKIVFVDMNAKKVEVIKAVDGKKPSFVGSGVTVDRKIRERILEVLFSTERFEFIDEAGSEKLEELRLEYSHFPVRNIQIDRPILVSDKYVRLFTFTGTKVNRALSFLLKNVGVTHILNDQCSMFEVEMSFEAFNSKWQLLHSTSIDQALELALENNPALLDFSKFGRFLPPTLQIALLKQRYFDFPQALQFVQATNFVFAKDIAPKQ